MTRAGGVWLRSIGRGASTKPPTLPPLRRRRSPETLPFDVPSEQGKERLRLLLGERRDVHIPVAVPDVQLHTLRGGDGRDALDAARQVADAVDGRRALAGHGVSPC